MQYDVRAVGFVVLCGIILYDVLLCYEYHIVHWFQVGIARNLNFRSQCAISQKNQSPGSSDYQTKQSHTKPE